MNKKAELQTVEHAPIEVRADHELQVTRAAAGAMQEIQAAMILAHNFPRNWEVSWQQVMQTCKRKTFAEKATYSFPRGESIITGPSVNLATVAAALYQHIWWGLEVLREDEETMLIQAWAWDMQTNVKAHAQDYFKKLIYRKAGGWIKPDERDLRELRNRRGAILRRNCLLQILPRDLIEDAQSQCRLTLKQEIKDPQGEKKRLIMSFAELGVTVEMLQRYVEHEAWNADDLVDLHGILTALQEGTGRREDYFREKEPPPTEIRNSKPTLTEGDATTYQGYGDPKGEK